MAGEFTADYDPGFTVYALAFDPALSLAWDGTTFVDPSGVRPDCALTMTDDGEGTYSGQLPDSLPVGNYLVQAYLQLGADPADADPLVGTGSVQWPGPAGSSVAMPDPTRSIPVGTTA